MHLADATTKDIGQRRVSPARADIDVASAALLIFTEFILTKALGARYQDEVSFYMEIYVVRRTPTGNKAKRKNKNRPRRPRRQASKPVSPPIGKLMNLPSENPESSRVEEPVSLPPVEKREQPSRGGVRADIPIEQIDFENTKFRFRINMRVADLVRSIRKNGQQFPVLLRRPRGAEKYEIVSGFRRITALRELRWGTVNAIIRDDLEDDSEACRVSIIENEIRKTYNDLDRAYAIVAYRRMGKSTAEIQEIIQVGSRQVERLQKLTTFPQPLQAAVADGRVPSTHAVRLMQHAGKHPDTDVDRWIQWIAENSATMSALNRELKAEVDEEKMARPIELFVEREKNGKKSLRVRPISIDDSLPVAQRKDLVEALKSAIHFVESLPDPS